MNVKTFVLTPYGKLKIDVPYRGMHSLQVLQYLAPDLRVECEDEIGQIFHVHLGEIDLTKERLEYLNADPHSVAPEPITAGS